MNTLLVNELCSNRHAQSVHYLCIRLAKDRHIAYISFSLIMQCRGNEISIVDYSMMKYILHSGPQSRHLLHQTML